MHIYIYMYIYIYITAACNRNKQMTGNLKGIPFVVLAVHEQVATMIFC